MVKVTQPVDSAHLPPKVRELLLARKTARDKHDFALSDQLRTQIAALGYLVNDQGDDSAVLKLGDKDTKPAKNFLLLFGSGEIAKSSVDIYRRAFLAFNKRDLRISLITTPAGFQPNVASVYGEIKEFLLTSLPDFNLTVDIVMANTHQDASSPALVSRLSGADIILLGPGSPTYAAKHLKNTPLLDKIIELVKNGSTLILASAATLAFSRYTLPVYEIYKVGEELHWLDGLDVFTQLFAPLTIIPHYNNTEGGSGLDTSFCFMGQGRGTQLLSLLPPSTPIIGLDEHTALLIDLVTHNQTIHGKGTIHDLTYSKNRI
ncbi:MAG: Cysteinyl-tRNA synthetase-like protein [Microgenomates group bacterium GW2011_GWD1_47_13]|uniref:Cysteinyl-tRNA ligase anticodon binding domain-containing protein n=2 Tax=Microgenomates group TaxID=1794810 RepID=A0A1F5F522_9BACT|nr:MAG: Cysteinyl-tRNA synthetase-like protein [Microgenomates group bacterium GW2011_GWF2_46_18]KKU42285.1 MAG: Cysteinyl-tRNA synthetase-like protein [Microgenomates group bacterium GW2011_GWA1_46_7]KKU45241.1 MAG: Cysteinyl-tRNA synthetase-like protein [Microgenomates group bacterium GW2011_GWB1_46_7]KKU60274.1 MAG: Cysteinyl-tRNA synthetase-like protein [Microgenomates group bacterium GW2011_GWD1_47_13]OGD74748.1 MAG: hypothetical protein A2228_02490 [Candidatus Collierbacteria bacterium RI